MKKNTILVLGLVLGLALAGTAFAGTDNGNGNGGNNNGNGNGKGGTPPAAPEPGLLLMVASGLALGGGYLVWRSKQKHASAM